jgi:hypothetical protein
MIDKNLKYCCDFFESRHRSYNHSWPNIMIVKYTHDFFINTNLSKNKINSPYRFWITFGHEVFSLDNVMINITYCPFCGKNLFEFYDSDEYVNEIEGKTFSMIK